MKLVEIKVKDLIEYELIAFRKRKNANLYVFNKKMQLGNGRWLLIMADCSQFVKEENDTVFIVKYEGPVTVDVIKVKPVNDDLPF